LPIPAQAEKAPIQVDLDRAHRRCCAPERLNYNQFISGLKKAAWNWTARFWRIWRYMTPPVCESGRAGEEGTRGGCA